MQLSALLDALDVDRDSRDSRDCDIDEPVTCSEIPCRVQDAELWFAELPAQVEQAKSLCLQCPVRSACLAGARERQEPWGVWGGELFLHGVVVPRKRPRGRPRKADVAA